MAEPFGMIFAAFRPMARQWAQWSLDGRTFGIAEAEDRKPQTIVAGDWKIKATFREWQFGTNASKDDPPPGTESPNGGAALAQVGDNEFIVVGQNVRLSFEHGAGKPSMFARVEEGHFNADGKWIMERNWNGDQTDYGVNLTARPTVMKIRMGTYVQ